MAHIHHSRNNLQKEYEALRDSRINPTRTVLRYATLIISVLFLIIFGLILFNLWQNPNIAYSVKSVLADKSSKWINTLEPFHLIQNTFIKKQLPDELILRSLIMIVECLLTILVFLIGAFIPDIVQTLIYLLPVLMALFSIKLFANTLNKEKWYDPPSDREDVLKAGIEGERIALDIISTLNNNYHVFTNVVVPYQNATSETDLIVVSPTGITIIEVKNKVGTVFGDLSHDELIQVKTLKNGNTIEKPFYNPVQQVEKHMLNLSGYLRSNGVNVCVKRSVLFVNQNSSLFLKDHQGIAKDCPVFLLKNSGALLDILCTGKPIGQENMDRVIELIERLVK